MKTKFAAVAAILLALLTIAAKEATQSPKLVNVGESYVISNGASAVKGKVVSELGDGWYNVNRADGGGNVAVNVSHAFFVQAVK